MIKILIADDDRIKTGNIVRAISDACKQDEIEIITVADAFSAKKNMLQAQYDILILDIYLPNRHGDDPAIENSLHIIRELTESEKFIQPIHIIGITQFDDAESVSKAAFYGNLFHIVRYDETSLVWKKSIVACIKYFIRVKNNILINTTSQYDYDIAIITAVQTPEFVAVLDLNAGWRNTQFSNDNSIYYSGVFQNEKKSLKVVSAVASQMGLPAAATLASKLIVHFRPKYLACVGIAAGIKGKGNYGDILVGDMVFDYGSGKITNDSVGGSVVQPDPNSIHLDSFLKDRFIEFQRESEIFARIKANSRATKPDSELKSWIGPFASGASVVQCSQTVNNIIEHNRKLIGIDMEAYGVFYSACNSFMPRPNPFCIKSISDFADSGKNDSYHTYAAHTSARYLYEFSLKYL